MSSIHREDWMLLCLPLLRLSFLIHQVLNVNAAKVYMRLSTLVASLGPTVRCFDRIFHGAAPP